MMNGEKDKTYEQLHAMYEMMQQLGDTEEVENAIFEYEDCVSEEDYARWREKYAHFL